MANLEGPDGGVSEMCWSEGVPGHAVSGGGVGGLAMGFAAVALL